MIFVKKQKQTRERPSSSVKTANNKIPVSSVFNDSEGLYRTTVCRCLVHRPHYYCNRISVCALLVTLQY